MTQTPPSPTILFAGGGTVGHLAPGFAWADALEARGLRTRFATPGEAREADWFAGRESPLTLPAVRLPRRPLAAAAFPLRLARCVRQARTTLRQHEIGCVVALGGWPCAPAALAARKAGARLVLFAADAVPGRVVRWLRRRADRIYVAHPQTDAALGGGAVVTGPLLRTQAVVGARDPAHFGLLPERRTLLVTGGSLGATGLNARVLDGLAAAVAADPALAARIQVVHATGGQEGIAERYTTLGIAHHVVPFLHDMGTAYATCDLFVGRAGAGTCAEVDATGVPALLVPYPHHRDRQQVHNAKHLAARRDDVRWVEESDLTPESFAREVLTRLADAPARTGNRPARDAATETADDLIRFLGWEPSSGT